MNINYDNGGWSFFDNEKQSQLNKLAVEYYETKAPKIFDAAAKLYIDCRKNIASTGKFAEFYKESNADDREDIVGIISEVFVKTFEKYNPEKSSKYCPYFRTQVNYALNDKYNKCTDDFPLVPIIQNGDGDEGEPPEPPVFLENIEESLLIAEGFIYLILRFFEFNKDNEGNQKRYIYFKDFYTGDIIEQTRILGDSIILRQFVKNESTILQSINDTFVDYIMFNAPRSLYEIKTFNMKHYSNINLESSKLKGEIMLPPPNVLYAAFQGVSDVAVKKRLAIYNQYRELVFKDVISEEKEI